MRVHQSGVGHRVQQHILRHAGTEQVSVWRAALQSSATRYPLPGRPAADHGVTLRGSLQREPQFVIVPFDVRVLELIGHVHASAEVLAGLRRQPGVHVRVGAAHSEGDGQKRSAGGRRDGRRSGLPSTSRIVSDVLGVRFLQQGSPELVSSFGTHGQQGSVKHGQEVVHHHVHPLPKSPELSREGPARHQNSAAGAAYWSASTTSYPEVKYPGVALKRLFQRNHLSQHVLVECERSDGGQKPAVT